MGLLSSVVGLGASFLASRGQKRAAGNIGRMYEEYEKKSIQDYRDLYKQADELTDPYRKVGSSALDIISKAMLEGDYSAFETSPGYQFRQQEAQKALERSAAARGGLLGGNVLKGIVNYSQNIASDEFGNWYNRLFNLSEVGRQTAENQAIRRTNLASALDNVRFRALGGTTGAAQAKAQAGANFYRDLGAFAGRVAGKGNFFRGLL